MTRRGPSLLVLLAGAAAAAHAAAPPRAAGSLAELSLEELSRVVVSSVSRRDQPVAEAAASVYVISAQDIRRSAATSLPEALRLAPNLIVARINAHDYAITTSRGLLSSAGNKLLVMIDGRSIYTPLFSGVLWDVNGVMLEDVERIEVISGPGGTTWGTNAVIGVINIVTKSAAATPGVLAGGYAGNTEDGAAVRYGGRLEALEGAAFRLYARTFDRDHFSRADGTPARDSGWRQQVGFRADWSDGRDGGGGGGDGRARAASGGFTLQGDAYRAEREIAAGVLPLSGFNLLGRFTRALADGARATVQAYFDRAERDDAGVLVQTMDIVDIEAQHAFAPLGAEGAHRVTAGAGWREADDRTRNDASFAFIPADRRLRWFNAFVQDEIALAPALRLTLGVRAERNSYTGWETMPSARLAWQPAAGRLAWAAASRAVRSPSRFDREAFVPAAPPFTVAGGPEFTSEVSNVFELGWRAQVAPALSYSLTAFHHRHDRLRSIEPGPGGAFIFANRIEGRTSGVEGWAAWQPARDWRLAGGLVLLDQDLVAEPGSAGNVFVEGNDPARTWQLRASHDFGDDLEFDLTLRHRSRLPSPQVPSFTTFDARVGWRVARGVELALAGRNLADPGHPEFGAAATRAEVPRALHFSVRLALP